MKKNILNLKESRFVNRTIDRLKKTGHAKTAINMIKDGLTEKGSQSRKDVADLIRAWRNHTSYLRTYRLKIDKQIKQLEKQLQTETSPEAKQRIKNEISKLYSNIYVNGASNVSAKDSFKQGLIDYLSKKAPDPLDVRNYETKIVKQPANKIVNRIRHMFGLEPKLVDKTIAVQKKTNTPYTNADWRAVSRLYDI